MQVRLICALLTLTACADTLDGIPTYDDVMRYEPRDSDLPSDSDAVADDDQEATSGSKPGRGSHESKADADQRMAIACQRKLDACLDESESKRECEGLATYCKDLAERPRPSDDVTCAPSTPGTPWKPGLKPGRVGTDGESVDSADEPYRDRKPGSETDEKPGQKPQSDGACKPGDKECAIDDLCFKALLTCLEQGEEPELCSLVVDKCLHASQPLYPTAPAL